LPRAKPFWFSLSSITRAPSRKSIPLSAAFTQTQKPKWDKTTEDRNKHTTSLELSPALEAIWLIKVRQSGSPAPIEVPEPINNTKSPKQTQQTQGNKQQQYKK
jgi:hypothetical protein